MKMPVEPRSSSTTHINMDQQIHIALIDPPKINLTPGELIAWKGYWWKYLGYNSSPQTGRMVIQLEVGDPLKKTRSIECE